VVIVRSTRALRAEEHPNHHHPNHGALGSSVSPLYILLLILVGSGATLLLTQIGAYASGEDNTGGSNVGGGGNNGGHLRNLSPRGYVNDGTILASTVYYSSSNSNSNSAALPQARVDRAGRSGNEAAFAAAEEEEEEEGDTPEEVADEENNVGAGAAAAGRGGDGSADPARPQATSNEEEGEGGGTIIGPDTQGGQEEEEEEERSLYFPRRSDPDSHKLFHDDIKMDKPWDAMNEKEEETEKEDPWPEPDITALDPTLVVTRNGVTHPAVAWLMSFPNRCVRMWRRRNEDDKGGGRWYRSRRSFCSSWRGSSPAVLCFFLPCSLSFLRVAARPSPFT
jgi:hypothetical protein